MAKKKKERVLTRSFTIDESHYKKLLRLGYGNASRGLRKLINDYKGVVPPEIKD